MSLSEVSLHQRRPVVIGALLIIFMAAVEATIVATAMPTIVRDLGGFERFDWVFAAFLLTQSVSIPIYGGLADQFGRKPVLTAGTILFLAASIACGFAGSMEELIAFRALQGLGAGAMLPVSMTMVGDLYGPVERARIQGMLAAVWGVAAIGGPLVGGLLAMTGDWPLVFWINLPVGVLALILLGRFYRDRPVSSSGPIDWPGAGLIVLGAGALMIALLQAKGITLLMRLALTVVAVVAFAALIWQERRAERPLLPLDIWQRRIVLVGNLGGLAIGAVMMGVIVFLPIWLQAVEAQDAVTAGLGLTAMSAGWVACSPLAGRLMIRTSYRTTALAGSFALIAGTTVLSFLHPGVFWGWPFLGAFLIGVGMAGCNTTFVVSIQSSVSQAERGAATSSNMFMRNLGQSVGTALFGAIFHATMLAAPGVDDDAIDRLIRHDGIDAGSFGTLVTAADNAAGQVYLAALALSVITLALAYALPRRIGPTSIAADAEQANTHPTRSHPALNTPKTR